MKIKLLFLVFFSSRLCFGQTIYSDASIDSIVSHIKKTSILKPIVDSGKIIQDGFIGYYRYEYTVDLNGDLSKIDIFIRPDKGNNGTSSIFYLYKTKLLKIELGDVYGGYKSRNITQLYYSQVSEKNDSYFQSEQLVKLKYLDHVKFYVQNFLKLK